jgi:L-asparaginase II
MLQKVHATESDLRCGGHASINPDLARRWIREGIVPTAIYNNCSGKHAGMLIGAEALGAPFANYQLPHHPMQVKIKQLVEELTELSSNEIRWGIDGCNMPAPALPLTVLAKTFALFANAADKASQDLPTSTREEYMSRIFNAMSSHPGQVGGVDRFCTILMEAYHGQLIGKVGADGCYGIGIKGSNQTRALGVKGALGIAVKVGDGNLEILYTAVTHILEKLGIGDSDTRKSLKRYHDVKLVNSMGVQTGHVSVPFQLHRVSNA